MVKKQTKSGLNLPFAEVAETYNTREQALRQFFNSSNPTYLAMVAGTAVGAPLPSLQIALLEADRDACLTLLAAVEAAFRLDYALRCEQRDKLPISRSFRALFQQYEYHIPLEDVLLEEWKTYQPGARSVISELKSAFKFRHWLAHGRYWTPKLALNVHRLNFYDLYSLTTLLESFGLLSPV